MIDNKGVGGEMYRLIEELYPICRSITGDGVRQTLAIIKKHIPLKTQEVPSGTKVFDWIVPKEWNIRGAHIKNSRGEKIVDFKDSNLHVISYSIPVRKRVSLDELKKHVFTLEEHPDWVPYRTSYYRENWGFCMAHSRYLALENGEHEVSIDTSLEDGSMTLGELVIKAKLVRKSWYPHTPVIPHSATTTCLASPCVLFWQNSSWSRVHAIPTGSCLYRARLDQSPGWLSTKISLPG